MCQMISQVVLYVTHSLDSYKRIHFMETPVMSAYLLAFAAGSYSSITSMTEHSIPVSLIFPSCSSFSIIFIIGLPSSSFQYALDASVHAFDYFQTRFSEPYPLSSLKIALSPNFAPAAMENYGLIICRGEYLMIEEGASQDLQRRVAYVLSHEIAHQWFGNLVTNRDWSDVYIQEGLATFYG